MLAGAQQNGCVHQPVHTDKLSSKAQAPGAQVANKTIASNEAATAGRLVPITIHCGPDF